MPNSKFDISKITGAFILASLDNRDDAPIFVDEILFDLKVSKNTLANLRNKNTYENISDEDVDALNHAVEMYKMSALKKTKRLADKYILIDKNSKLNEKYLTLLFSHLKSGNTKIEELKGCEDELRALQIIQDALTDESLAAETAERMSSIVERKSRIRENQENTLRINKMLEIFSKNDAFGIEIQKELLSLIK